VTADNQRLDTYTGGNDKMAYQHDVTPPLSPAARGPPSGAIMYLLYLQRGALPACEHVQMCFHRHHIGMRQAHA